MIFQSLSTCGSNVHVGAGRLSLGFDARGGLMERAERFIVLAFGLLFSELFVGVLWLMLALTAATAVFRFVKVWRQASVDRPVAVRTRPASRRRALRRARRPTRSRPGTPRPTCRSRGAAR